MHRCLLLLAAALLPTSLATGATFVETFDGGANEGGWSYFGTAPDGSGGPDLMLQPGAGGNPGAHILTQLGYATFAPTLQTKPGTTSAFTGDWATRNVTSIGVDLATRMATFSAAGRPISLRLWNDNGTPYDFLDDWGFWFVGPDNMPLVGEGWISYDFAIDAAATTTPSGWIPYYFDGSDASGLQWADLMADVDRVDFYHGEPDFFYILQDWQLGVDNARIDDDPTGACPTDTNGDGATDVTDLVNVILDWGTDGSGHGGDVVADGLVDVSDLVAVVLAWGDC